MTLYRPHRGSLAAAMSELIIVSSKSDLVDHLREVMPGLDEYDMPTEANTKIEWYCRDDRIGWDTWVVTVNGRVWGFTNENLT